MIAVRPRRFDTAKEKIIVPIIKNPKLAIQNPKFSGLITKNPLIILKKPIFQK